MKELKDKSMTIYEAVLGIQDGKYVMPAFQRQFVWSMEQIEKLWDSILLDYPISTFLFWHVDEANVNPDTYFCTFLTDGHFNSRKVADDNNYALITIDTRKTDTAVLDGQQRLTSLYLSLLGKTVVRPKSARKSSGPQIISNLLIELNKNHLTVDEEEYNSKKYDVRFTEKAGKLSPTQFEFKKILDSKFRDTSTREDAVTAAIANVPADSKEYAKNLLIKLCSKVYDEKLIRYTEIHGMNQDDALEMFVRFNAGGRPLKKAEITMAILEAYWPSAKTMFGQALTGAFCGFGTDFIIRTALMLYGDVVKSSINKQTADDLKNNWPLFVSALGKLAEALQSLKIDISRFSSSWNVLLPIIYYIYFNQDDYEKNLDAIRAYLIRAVLFTYFQSGTTAKLQQMKSVINSNDYELTTQVLDQLYDLSVTDGRIEDVLNSEKGSRVAGEALYYLSRNWLTPNLQPEQDHLHPYERFDETKPPQVDMNDWKRWRSMRGKLPNLHLMDGPLNASKGRMALQQYYDSMNRSNQMEFESQAAIPPDTSLDICDFESFYEARKNLLASQLRELMR